MARKKCGLEGTLIGIRKALISYRISEKRLELSVFYNKRIPNAARNCLVPQLINNPAIYEFRHYPLLFLEKKVLYFFD